MTSIYRCPTCGMALPSPHSPCPSCSRTTSARVVAPLVKDVAVAVHKLEALWRVGALDLESYSQLRRLAALSLCPHCGARLDPTRGCCTLCPWPRLPVDEITPEAETQALERLVFHLGKHDAVETPLLDRVMAVLRPASRPSSASVARAGVLKPGAESIAAAPAGRASATDEFRFGAPPSPLPQDLPPSRLEDPFSARSPLPAPVPAFSSATIPPPPGQSDLSHGSASRRPPENKPAAEAPPAGALPAVVLSAWGVPVVPEFDGVFRYREQDPSAPAVPEVARPGPVAPPGPPLATAPPTRATAPPSAAASLSPPHFHEDRQGVASETPAFAGPVADPSRTAGPEVPAAPAGALPPPSPRFHPPSTARRESPPPPPRKPAQPLSKVFAAFMEERHIRWGELAGGLLVIGSSIALVISLWSTIAEIPLLKFAVFTAVTGAIFGVGLYTHRRWKLPTTSRSLLAMGLLLVPLNFLAIGAFKQSQIFRGPGPLAGEAITAAVFLGLAWLATRVLTPRWPGAVALGLLGGSVSQVVSRLAGGPANDSRALFLGGAWVLACLGASVGRTLARPAEEGEPDSDVARSRLYALGFLTFPAILALGFLAYQSGDALPALRRLAPLIGLTGLPALAVGLSLWQGLRRSAQAGLRVAGTGVAIAGALVLNAALVLAWPTPVSLAAAGAVAFLSLTGAAGRFAFPAGYWLGAPGFTVAALTGIHLVTGRLVGTETPAQLVGALFSAASGLWLTPLAALYGLLAGILAKRHSPAASRCCAQIALGLALASFGVASGFGLGRAGDPHGLTGLYLAQMVAALIAAWLTRQPVAAWGALALGLLAAVQGLVYRWPIALPWPTVFLVVAFWGVIGSVAAASRRFPRGAVFAQSARAAVFGGTAVAAILLLTALPNAVSADLTPRLLGLAALCLTQALLARSAAFFSVGQLVLALAAVVSIRGWLLSQPWFHRLAVPGGDVRVDLVSGLTLAGLGLLWALARRLLARASGPAGGSAGRPVRPDPAAPTRPAWLTTLHGLLNPAWPAVDRLLTGGLVGFLLAVTIAACQPGILRELTGTTRLVPLADLPSLGPVAWALLGALVLTLLVEWRGGRSVWVRVGLLLSFFVLSLLLAGLWGQSQATASALRWLLTFFLVAASAPICLRRENEATAFSRPPFGHCSSRDDRGGASPPDGTRRVTAGLLFLLTVAPVVILTGLALPLSPRPLPPVKAFPMADSWSYLLPLVLQGAVMVAYAVRERTRGYLNVAGLFWLLAVSAALFRDPAMWSEMGWIRFWQRGAVTAGLFAFAWKGGVGWLARWTAARSAAPSLRLEALKAFHGPGPRPFVLFSLLAGAVPLVSAALALVAWPPLTGSWTAVPRTVQCVETAGVWGWLALLALLAAAWPIGPFGGKFRVGAVLAALLGAGTLTALSLTPWDRHNWLVYHAWLVAVVAAPWLLTLAGLAIARSAKVAGRGGDDLSALPAAARPPVLTRLAARFSAPDLGQAFAGWALAGSGLAFLLTLRTLAGDPSRPGWSVGALLALAALQAVLAVWRQNRVLLGVAGLLVSLAANLGWFYGRPVSGLVLLEVNAVALAGPGLLWLILERRYFRGRFEGPDIHHLAGFGAWALTGLAVADRLLTAALSGGPLPGAATAWTALAVTAGLHFVSLWGPPPRFSPVALHTLGLAALGLAAIHLGLTSPPYATVLLLLVAGYTLLTSLAWHQRRRFAGLAARLGLSRPASESAAGPGWFIALNAGLVCGVVALAGWDALFLPEPFWRLAVALALLSQAAAVGWLGPKDRDSAFPAGALGLVFLGVLSAAWVALDLNAPDLVFNRAGVALATAVLLAALYGCPLLGRFTAPVWLAAARRLSVQLSRFGVAIAVFMLTAEYVALPHGDPTFVAPPALVLFAVGLLGLSLLGLGSTLHSRFNPLGLAAGQLTLGLALADLFLVMLFIHLRLTAVWWQQAGWFPFHLAVAILLLLALVGAGVGWWKYPPPVGSATPAPLRGGPLAHWVNAVALTVTALVLVSLGGNPLRAGGPTAALAAGGLALALNAAWTGRQGYLYQAGALAQGALTLWLTAVPVRSGLGPALELGGANVLLLAGSGLAGLVLDLRVMRRKRLLLPAGQVPPFHGAATGVALAALAFFATLQLHGVFYGAPVDFAPAGNHLALAALGVLLLASLADPWAVYLPSAGYLYGLTVTAWALAGLGLTPRWTAWAAIPLTGVFALIVAGSWKAGQRWGGRLARWGLPVARFPWAGLYAWAVSGAVILGLLAAGLGLWAALTFSESIARLAAAASLLLPAVALGLLADERWGRWLRPLALGTGAVAAVLFGWAGQAPGTIDIDRGAVLLVVLAALLALFGLGLVRTLPAKAQAWREAACRITPALAVLAGATLLFLFLVEIAWQARLGRVPISLPAALVVLTALLGAAAGALITAAAPGRDPLGLPDRLRGAYVYAAEGLVGASFMHLRLSLPWLFHGEFERYWPLVVMVLAFLGVGLGEYCQRRRRLVFASPLLVTGIFLPLLPVLGYWALPSVVPYPGVMAAAGALYGALSVSRRSFGFGLLAALLANGGLWHWLCHTEDLRFDRHPQLWLIPLGLSVLLAAHLNRDRLTPGQMTFIRYLSLMTVYLSSSAEIFLHGVRSSLWLPLVLMVLSVAGVLLGMVLRVRSFLFLGTAFLLLSLVTVILHASVNLGWTWIWYVAGIVLGLLIIFLFALFEKKRQELQQLVEGLKEWEG